MARQRSTGLPTKGLPTQGIPTISLNDGSGKEPHEYPLFELALLKRLRTPDNKVGVHGRSYVSQNRVYIRLCALRQRGSTSVTVLVCSNGYLLVRSDDPGKASQMKQIPWFQSPKKEILAIALDPSGRQAVCACRDGSLYIIPVYTVLNQSTSVKHSWKSNDLTEITSSSHRGIPTKIIWWTSSDGRNVGIVGNGDGEIILIDLGLRKEVKSLWLKEEILSLEIVQHPGLCYLIIQSDMGTQWGLILEKTRRKLNPVERANMEMTVAGFEVIHPQNALNILYAQDGHTLFQPYCFHNFMDVVILSTQSALDHNFVAAHDYSSNIFKIFDSSIDNWLPLHVYRLPPQCSDILLTDRLIFALYNHFGVTVLGIFSSHMSEISDHSHPLNEGALMQKFFLPSGQTPIGIFKCSFPVDYLESRVAPSDPQPSTSSQPNTEAPSEHSDGKTSQTLLSKVERHTVLEGCVLVTDVAVYQCRPRISPEGLFLDLAMEESETSLPDNLGISLGLDMNGLYELAANQRLAEGQTILAMRLYHRSECSQVKQVANFVKQGYMQEAISLIRSAIISPNLATADKRLLADTAVKCYLHQILEGRSDEALMAKFRQYLMDNFDYSETAAMEIFAEHGMQDLVFEVAKARGLVGVALEALLATGSPELDCEQQCLLINQGFISTMSNAGDNAFLLCMTTQEAVNRLVEKPELMYRYMELFNTVLDDLKLSLLMKLAWLFDPSKSTIKPLLSRAVHTTKSRADIFSASIDTMASDESIDSPLDTSQSFPKPSALLEFYLKVLIILNHRMTMKGDSTSLVNFDPSSTSDQTLQENVVSLPQQKNMLSCGQYHVAMVSEDDVYTWGTAHGGRLGHGDIIPADGRSAPFRVETLHMHRIRVISVACGKEHTMVLEEQGRLYTWGTSKWGQLGLGDRTTHTRPMLVQALTGTCCVAIACGQYHSLALTRNQKVFSWGWGVHGQLGHGVVEDQLQPCHITSLDRVKVTQMSAGYCHSLVVTANGQVYVFGAGTFGQLGLGKQVIKRNVPTLLDGFDGDKVTMVACGLFHNIAVTSNPQKVYMWGKSPLELRQSLQASRKRRTARDGADAVVVGRRRSVTVMETRPDAYDENQYLRPYAFDFGQIQAPIKQLACSMNHNLILTSGGQLYSFGKNDCGQLGLGHRAEQRVPVLLRLSESQSIAAVGAGVEFSVAITTQGQVYSWGSPENGQLGIDTSCRSHLQMQPSFHVNLRVAKSTSLTRIVLNPMLVPGIPLVTMASGLGMNDSDGESDEDDMGSSDDEEEVLDWDLPNLSTSDPSESPYGPESLALSLQALDSHYNHQAVLRLCQDWEVWPAAAQICEMDKNYPLALLYRLKDRQCKGTGLIGAGEEGVLREITALVDKFIRLTCEQPSIEATKDTGSQESCKHLLVQILQFWAEQDLPQEALESLLRNHLDKVAYPLSVLLLCDSSDSSKTPDVSSTSLVSQDLIKRFTSKFILELTSIVIQGIHQGKPHDDYLLPSTTNQETPSENNAVDPVKPLLTHSDIYTQKGDKATAERLWQEILFNLGKDIKARAHVGISKSEIAGLVDSNPAEENANENADCLVFTCGHHYRKRNLQENIMPLWNSKMAALPVPLPSNAQSLSNQYMTGEGCIPMACPNCVHSSLQLEQLKQLDKVL